MSQLEASEVIWPDPLIPPIRKEGVRAGKSPAQNLNSICWQTGLKTTTTTLDFDP